MVIVPLKQRNQLIVLSPVKDDIQDYVQAFRRGEEAGFTYFFNSFYKALTYYAFRIIQDRQTAEEIVSDSFIKIWQRHETFEHVRVIRSWLYTTVRHSCIDWLRQRQTAAEHEQRLADRLKDAVEASVLHELIRAEVIREIHAAITNLPPQCRQVFKLLYIQGKSLKQVAEEMQLSIHTIKNQRARGLTILKKTAFELYILLAWLPVLLHE